MARYQHPNPGDLLFFAADAAQRRVGLPGTTAHIHLHLRGQLDLALLQRAIAGLHRVYPVLAARCAISPRTGWPRWRLDATPPAPGQVVHVHAVSDNQLHPCIETLLNEPIDFVRRVPLELHIFRGPPAGDMLVMRWTHTLMDGGGGLTILQELDRLYRETPDLSALQTRGDERRDDFRQMLARIPWTRRINTLLTLLSRRGVGRGAGVQISPARSSQLGTHLRYVVRQLTPEKARLVRDNAARVCPTARPSDYVRASALRALHQMMPQPLPRAGRYTLMNYIDNRRHQPGAVCWNFTTALPIEVPVCLAHDRRRVAESIRAQMEAHRAADTATRDALNLWLITRPPTAYIAAIIRADFGTHGTPAARIGMRMPLSLPLGIMGPFAQPLPTFCGVEVANYYAFRAPVPQPGFAVDVHLTEDRLNVVGTCLESCVPLETLTALVDRFVDALLDPC